MPAITASPWKIHFIIGNPKFTYAVTELRRDGMYYSLATLSSVGSSSINTLTATITDYTQTVASNTAYTYDVNVQLTASLTNPFIYIILDS